MSLPIPEKLLQYVQNRVNLLKEEGIHQTASIIAQLVIGFTIVLVSCIATIFLSITLALLAASQLGSIWKGFGCITILFLLIAATVRMFKITFRNAVIRSLIKKTSNIINKSILHKKQ